MPPKKRPPGPPIPPANLPVAPRKRGRPRKHQQRDHDAADALSELPLSPILTGPPSPEPPLSEMSMPSSDDTKIAGALKTFFNVMDEFLSESPKVKALVQAEIRRDPRTEELKEVKARLASFSGVTKEEAEYNKRILKDISELRERQDYVANTIMALDKRIVEQVTQVKRQCEELQATNEGVSKRVATIEARAKALESRAKATDDRVTSVEERCK